MHVVLELHRKLVMVLGRIPAFYTDSEKQDLT